MKHWSKKLLGILLCAAMVIGMLPGIMSVVDAWAYDGNPYKNLVNTTPVTFNGIQWYIIKDQSTAVNAGTVTLLAKDPIGASAFGSNNAYNGSSIETWLSDYYSNHFGNDYNDAIETVTPWNPGGNDAKLWLLSQTEAYDYINNNVRKCSKASDASENLWWTRSKAPRPDDTFAMVVSGEDGSTVTQYKIDTKLGVRPALKLKLSAVIFSPESKLFMLPHTHNFTYSASGATVTATCLAGCPDGYDTTGIKLTLKPPADLKYDSNPKTVTIEGYPSEAPAGLEAKPTAVSYYKSTGVGSTMPNGNALQDAPSKCGNYVAQMVWNNVTASLPFSITSDAITFTVTFKVVNGGWDSDGSTDPIVVKLSRQKNEDLLLILKDEQIPTAGNKPAPGFMMGDWIDPAPSTERVISEDKEYTYAYKAKATAALTVTQSDGVYSTVLADPVYTRPAGAIGNPVITYSGKVWDGAAYGPTSGKPTQAGNYMVSVTEETADTVYSGNASFSVTPKSITGATVSLDKTQLTYNGSEQTVNVTGVTIDGLSLSGDDYEVTGNTGIDQGTYTVTVKGKGNFKDSATAEWSIVEKAMTVSVAGYNGAYDGTAHGISVSVEDPEKGATVKYGTAAGTYDLDTSPTLTDVGTLTVYFKVTADNYTDYTGSAVVTITEKPAAVVTAPPAPKTDLVCNGTAQELITAGEAAGGTMKYTLSDNVTAEPESGWSAALPTGVEAGTYYVWFKAFGDADHVDSAAAYVTATIAKAPEPPVPPVPKDKEINGEVGTKGKNKLALKWAAVNGAEGYELFFTECGSELKHYKTVKPDVTEWTFKKLDVGTPYKMQVKAYVMQDGEKKYIGHTDTLHCITNGSNGHYTNAVKIKAKDQTIAEGEKKQLKVTLKGEEKGLPILPHGGAVRYESMNPDIATVDKDGNVKGVSTGSCKILLSTADGLRKTIVLTVKAGPEELRFGKKKYKVEVGKTLNLKKKLKISPSDAEVSLKWKSSDKSIAKVDKNGKVTGRKKGTVKITVTASNGVSVTVKVKVK